MTSTLLEEAAALVLADLQAKVEPIIEQNTALAEWLEKSLATLMRQWRDNSRTRVRKGQRPKVFSDVPARVFAQIWPLLESATTRQQVDAAFAALGTVTKGTKLSKTSASYRSATMLGVNCAACSHMHPDGTCDVVAGIVAPDMVCDYFAPTVAKAAEMSEHERLCRILTDHYGPLLIVAWKAAFAVAANKAKAIAEKHGRVEKASADQSAAATAAATEMLQTQIDTSDLLNILRDTLGDGYLAGAQIAAGQLGGAATLSADLSGVLTEINWDSWQPGYGQAAEKVAGQGLADLLDAASVTIKNVTETQLQNMADVLSAGLDAGSAPATIADAISQALDDSLRGDVIARTEGARAMISATMDTYTDSGISKFNVLLGPNPCDICIDEESLNPHNMGDDAGPYHPNCTCGTTAVIETSGGELETGDEGT